MSKDFELGLQNVLDKHKNTDGTFDVDKAQVELQGQFNGFIAKNKPNMEELKTTAKAEALTDFFTEVGIENVTDKDTFLDYKKTLLADSDTSSKELVALKASSKTANVEWETKYNKLNKDHSVLSTKVMVTDNGFNPKYSNAVSVEYNALIASGKEKDEAIKSIKETYPEFLSTTTKGGKTPKNNNTIVKEDAPKKRWNKFN